MSNAVASKIIVSDSVSHRMRADGRMCGGDAVFVDGEPVYVGTFGECVRWAEQNVARRAWRVSDARGVFTR